VGRLTLDADQLVPGLWQGSFPPPGGLVRSAGFGMLVLCAREIQPPATDFPGVEVVHAPNDDHHALRLDRPKLTIALEAAQRVVQAVREGQQVLVTCAAGLNRSGLVSGIALHLLFGWPGVKCIAHVRKYRTRSRVHPGRGSLSNNDFVNALTRLGPAVPEKQTLEQRLAKAPTIWVPR